MSVIEQLTYLLFIKRLDELHTLKEAKAARTGQSRNRGDKATAVSRILRRLFSEYDFMTRDDLILELAEAQKLDYLKDSDALYSQIEKAIKDGIIEADADVIYSLATTTP